MPSGSRGKGGGDAVADDTVDVATGDSKVGDIGEFGVIDDDSEDGVDTEE